jgi:hypothetical protein
MKEMLTAAICARSTVSIWSLELAPLIIDTAKFSACKSASSPSETALANWATMLPINAMSVDPKAFAMRGWTMGTLEWSSVNFPSESLNLTDCCYDIQIFDYCFALPLCQIQKFVSGRVCLVFLCNSL